MKYVYPVIFTPEDNGYSVKAPDLPGCFTYGDSLADAIDMARDAISMWLCDAEDKSEPIPPASDIKDVVHDANSFVNLIDVDTDFYRKENDNRAVKKTLTIPSWLNAKAEKANINFSQVLQTALKDHLGIKDRS
ncbi:MAG: type II toxin-antitoxin system HicB family antitoxin [Thermoanaerobacteraceae bacterium]|nr:type II toxin-antitoxin system HicB family antitoxin [Thermoanaerobacteraceae bacterium]